MGKIETSTWSRLLKALVLSLLCAIALACKDAGIVIAVQKATEVLEEPYPGDYPNTNNRVLATLNQGQRIEVLHIKYGKDYAAYQVRLEDGRLGYVISGGGFHLEKVGRE